MSDIREHPIAVFDSGVGGISVLRALVELMPNENYIYFGDSAHAPYGTKSLQEVRELTEGHVIDLLEQGAKAVVIACNTATSADIGILRERYPNIPMIGIEPALKPAVFSGVHPKVLVLGTPMTIRQVKFVELMERYREQAEILPLPCPGLMEYVERGEISGEAVETFVTDLLGEYRYPRVDAVVLGCTHYPFLSNVIQKVLGESVRIFEGGQGTARETRRRLQLQGLDNPQTTDGTVVFQNSSGSEEKIALCKTLLKGE